MEPQVTGEWFHSKVLNIESVPSYHNIISMVYTLKYHSFDECIKLTILQLPQQRGGCYEVKKVRCIASDPLEYMYEFQSKKLCRKLSYKWLLPEGAGVFIFLSCTLVCTNYSNVSVKSKLQHPPPGQPPRHLTFSNPSSSIGDELNNYLLLLK